MRRSNYKSCKLVFMKIRYSLLLVTLGFLHQIPFQNNAFAQRFDGPASDGRVRQSYMTFQSCMNRACQSASAANQASCQSCEQFRRSALPASPPPREEDLDAANMNRPANTMPPAPCMNFIMGGHCFNEALALQSAISAYRPSTTSNPQPAPAATNANASSAPTANPQIVSTNGSCPQGSRPITQGTRTFIESLKQLRNLYGRARCNSLTSFAANDLLRLIEQDRNPRELATALESATSGAWNNIRWTAATVAMQEARGARERIQRDVVTLMRGMQQVPFVSEIRLRCSAQCQQNPQARCEFALPLERDRMAWQAVPSF